IQLRPTPDDLEAILKHLYGRFGGRDAKPLPAPPASLLRGWHKEYGCALEAFCFAALDRLAEFERGNWDLPTEAASDWVREKWLNHLDLHSRENALCLAVFGAQELELDVQKEALPHQDKTDQLLRIGLVEEKQLGRFGQYHRFKLREPGWGRLILAAQVPRVDEEKILFETAARHPTAALFLSARLRQEGSLEQLAQLWAYLATSPARLVELALQVRLDYLANLVTMPRKGVQPLLALRFWEEVESNPAKVAERAWETPLGKVGSFLRFAKQQRRNTASLWDAMESDPKKLAGRAWETSLDKVGSFLSIAKQQGRNTAPLWDAIESDPKKLAERAWETSLSDLGSFLSIAKQQGRDTAPLWDAIERDPKKLAERAWDTPLEHIASFQHVAAQEGRDCATLWKTLEAQPKRLSALASGSSTGELAAFCRQAPDSLVNPALAEIQASHWDAIPYSEPLIGAVPLASRCAEVGREDLKSAIITTLFRRANPEDFPPQAGSLFAVAWLLQNSLPSR